MMYDDFAPLLLGKTKEEAQALCVEDGRAFRVVDEDGERYMLTADLHPTRINVSLLKGKVVSVRLG